MKNKNLSLEFDSFPDGFYVLSFKTNDYFSLEITFSKIGIYWKMISNMYVDGELLNLYGRKVKSLELIKNDVVQIEYKGIDLDNIKDTRIYYIKI